MKFVKKATGGATPSAAVAVAAMLLLSGCGAMAAGSAANKPPDVADTPALVVTVMGATGSDVAQRDIQLGHLRNVVAPRAALDRARVIVGIVSDSSFTRPQVIGDVNLDVAKEAGGNPFTADDLRTERTKQLENKVSEEMSRLQPAPASDPFGAVLWAESILSQFPSSTKKLLVLLTDAVATVNNCNLTGRDLTPAFRPKVLADCTRGRTPRLAGVEVWQGGAGLSLGDDLPDATALAIEDLFRQFWDMTGANLTRYGTILVGAASNGRQ